MSSTTFSVFSFEEINHVSECSHDFLFTSANDVLKFDVVPRFSGMVLVFVDLSEVLVVTTRAVPASVFPEQIILSVPRAEIFSLPLVSRLHYAVEPVVTVSGSYVVDVYV